MTVDGTTLWNKPPPLNEAKRTKVYLDLSVKGAVLVVADEPANIGALDIAVAQHLSTTVAHLPRLTMRRVADMYPGTAKADENMLSSSMTRPAPCRAHYAASWPRTRKKLPWPC